MLKAFAKKIGRDLQDRCRFRTGEFHDLAEHVGQAMWPVEALKHSERASDLDFLNQQQPFRLTWRLKVKSTGEIFSKPIEAQVHLLDGTLLHIENIVHGYPISPRPELAAEVEPGQPGDDADEDLLRCVFSVFAVAQHAQCETIDVTLQCSHNGIESIAISVECSTGMVFEHSFTSITPGVHTAFLAVV